MQSQYEKPLKKSVSFWGILITLILIFLLMLSLADEKLLGMVMIATLGLAFLPIAGAASVLAIAFVVFGIIFTIYLTRRLGHSIRKNTPVNKPILAISLALGILIVLGLSFTLAVNLPRYLV